MSTFNETKLKKLIAAKAGMKIRGYMVSLHTKILNATAYNTGRTLASWHGSAGDSPILIDAADIMGRQRFEYGEGVDATNHVVVGMEHGDRESLERFSLKSTRNIDFEWNPYRKFWIANGARLDSGAGIFGLDSLNSSLPQGTGSRAAMQEAGTIAAYDVYSSMGDLKVYSFIPRTEQSFQITVESFRAYPTVMK